MTMIWSLSMVGASFMAWATAWADSMAGMMPSVRGQILKCVHGFVVRNWNIFGPADIVQICVLRADAGIIQPCGNGVDRCDLAVFILAEIGLHAVENAQPAGVDGGSCFKGIDAAACRLAADQAHILILDEMVEAADGIGTAAHAGDDGIGQPAFLFQHLLLDLLGDDRLEITDDGGERVRPHDGTEAVMGIVRSGWSTRAWLRRLHPSRSPVPVVTGMTSAPSRRIR